MNQQIETDQWVEMNYNGRNGSPITFKGYLNRQYRVHVTAPGEVKQTGAVVRRAGTVLVHPEDVVKLQRLQDRGTPLFTLLAPPESEEVPEEEIVIDATESALALAGEEGVDLAQVSGSGANGRITKGDVQKYVGS